MLCRLPQAGLGCIRAPAPRLACDLGRGVNYSAPGLLRRLCTFHAAAALSSALSRSAGHRSKSSSVLYVPDSAMRSM